MNRKAKISIILLLCSPIVVASYTLLATDNSGLAEVHNAIEYEFANVRHIDGDQLSKLKEEEIILFDVRETSEYNVSHLKDAIHVDPEMLADDFVEKFSDISNEKTVIFYCSVGQRSSDFADRVQGALISSGAKAAYNLEGGIFKWHNERRVLFDKNAKPTQYVHPYDAIWGRMVKDQQYVQY